VTRGSLRFTRPPAKSVSLIGIYRSVNVSNVRKLIRPAIEAGWTTAWWALDEIPSSLAEHTVGSGAGEKLPLLNEIVERASLDDGWTVAADDDVAFVRGSVTELVSVCAAARFALAQPALAAGSAYSHEITLSRALSIARRTSFVEAGPLFVVAPSCRDRVLPFPAWRGMGWGVEFEWYELLEHGFLLGIVDMISVLHPGPIGEFYDARRLNAAMKSELTSRATTWTELQKTFDTWRPWQRRAPWWRKIAAGSTLQ
jgi:hypothetical protein